MEQPQDNTDQSSSENIFEPFPKPNTIPLGWDLSAITSVDGKKVEGTENQQPLCLE